MSSVVSLILVIIAAIIAFVFPSKYDKYFSRKYHENAVSFPLSIITAIVTAAWLVLRDFGGTWYWIVLVLFIILAIASVLYPILKGIGVGAGISEIFVAVLAQIVSIAGIVIMLFVLINMLYGGKKKKKH